MSKVSCQWPVISIEANIVMISSLSIINVNQSCNT